MTREELKAEALINLGSEPAPKEWEKLPCIKEQMPSCIGGEVSLQRFVGTDICAWFVGIGGLWEPQSDYFRVSLPPAEGAEEITARLNELLGNPDKSIHVNSYQIKPIIVDGKAEWWIVHHGIGLGEPLAQWHNKFAALHAQRIAEKMVSERLRGELIRYIKRYGGFNYEDMTDEMLVNEYLKTREP